MFPLARMFPLAAMHIPPHPPASLSRIAHENRYVTHPCGKSIYIKCNHHDYANKEAWHKPKYIAEVLHKHYILH